jgi:hypothetical protein
MKHREANVTHTLYSLDSLANLLGVGLVQLLHPLCIRRLASRRRRRSLEAQALASALALASTALRSRAARRTSSSAYQHTR